MTKSQGRPADQRPDVVIHLKELSEDDESLRELIEQRCDQLAEEFREITRVEVSVHEDGAEFAVSGHATGKSTDIATHATASEIAPAVDAVLAKVQRQLRRAHDKRIFSQRREAQRDPPKRKNE